VLLVQQDRKVTQDRQVQDLFFVDLMIMEHNIIKTTLLHMKALLGFVFKQLTELLLLKTHGGQNLLHKV